MMTTEGQCMDRTRAWVVKDVGAFPTVEDVTIPSPPSGEVLVKVSAVGLNFADLLMIDGTYQDTPPVPFVPGMEFAGVVQELGDGVRDLHVGQRVTAFAGHGALAAHVVVSAATARPLPDTMDDVTAAGFQVAYGTSHLALTRRARLCRGKTLVVLGAAGGVGLTAVEIGRHLGARVVAVARGADRLAVAKDAGAEVLIDGADDDLVARMKDVGPVDVVYDAVGGATGDAALRVLAPEGRYLVIGFASGSMPAIRPNHLLVKNQTVSGFYWGGYMRFRPDILRESLDTLIAWHAKGLIRPHVSHVLPFERALDGLDLLRNRHATGKVVITL